MMATWNNVLLRTLVALGCLTALTLTSGNEVAADKQSSQLSKTPSGQRNERVRRWWGRGPRTAAPTQVGKNHMLVRSAFKEVVEPANRFTVRVFSNGEQVALGIIVDSDGWVVTKASETAENLTCRIAGHGSVAARQVASNEALDLALLRVDAKGLLPVSMTTETRPAVLGSWVAVPSGFGDKPLVVGVVSGLTRSIERDIPALGVIIEDSPQGVVVSRVLAGSGAEAAGVEEGDVITRADEVMIARQRELVRHVRLRIPGDKVALTIRRNGEERQIESTLSRARDVAIADQGGVTHLGGAVSGRQSGFPRVIQHDCLIQPNQCGGPLVNIDGQVVGLNIARAGRVTSFALPSDLAEPAIRELLAAAKRKS